MIISLKVTLADTRIVHQVLRSKNKVLGSRRISIEADLPPVQLQELNSKTDDLGNRKANGETDLVLRYSKAI